MRCFRAFALRPWWPLREALKSFVFLRILFALFVFTAMRARADLPTISGADGAVIRLSVEGATLRVDYEAPDIEKPQHRVFIALDSDPAGGAAILPFAQRGEGSTVFLPFNADQLYSVMNTG